MEEFYKVAKSNLIEKSYKVAEITERVERGEQVMVVSDSLATSRKMIRYVEARTKPLIVKRARNFLMFSNGAKVKIATPEYAEGKVNVVYV